MVIATHQAEWDAVKKLRNSYFFKLHNIDDPYTWTLDDPLHKHLIFYQGTDIIGYAHIQLWTEKTAALQVIVIEETNCNNGFGTRLLQLCEKYLKNLGYNSLHAHIPPNALTFFKKNNYSEMPFNDPDCYESDPQDTDVRKNL